MANTIGTFHLPAGISTEDYEGLLALISKAGSYDAATKTIIIKNGTGEDAVTLYEIPLDVTGQFSGDAASVGCTVSVGADGKIKVDVDQTAIQKNAEDIAKNAEDIAKNAEDIAKNAEDIAAVDGKIATAIGGMAHDVTYENLTLTIPMKAADGTEGTPLVVNIPKDNFVRSGSYDANTKEIVLVVDDDTAVEGYTEVRIPAAALVDVYTADNTGLGGVEMAVSSDNKISGKILVDTTSILSVNTEGKLTIDTTAIYQAIADAKSELEGKITAAQEALQGNIDALDEKVDALYTPAEGETAASGTIATELARIDGAHNTLAQTVADNKQAFDEHTHAYADITGTPTKLSDFTNDLDIASSDAVAAKQDKVVVYEATLAAASWTAGEDGATYSLDLTAADIDWAKDNVVDITPKTAADGDVCLNAKVSSVTADAGNGILTISAESVPSADVAVVVVITPDVAVVGA